MAIEGVILSVLGRDAELGTSKDGKQCVRMSVRFIGEGEAAQWINVTSLDAQAIATADNLVKGCRVYCEASCGSKNGRAKTASRRRAYSARRHWWRGSVATAHAQRAAPHCPMRAQGCAKLSLRGVQCGSARRVRGARLLGGGLKEAEARLPLCNHHRRKAGGLRAIGFFA